MDKATGKNTASGVFKLNRENEYKPPMDPEMRIGNPFTGIFVPILVAIPVDLFLFIKADSSFGIVFGLLFLFIILIIGYNADIKGTEIKRFNKENGRKGGYISGLLWGDIVVNHMKRKYPDFNPDFSSEEQEESPTLWTCNRCGWKSAGIYCDRCGLAKGDNKRYLPK